MIPFTEEDKEYWEAACAILMHNPNPVTPKRTTGAWQKCPVCEGTGKKAFPTVFNTSEPCSVCVGEKIINTATGKPPC